MAQHLHLEHGLLLAHGPNDKFLGTHDPGREGFLLLLHRRGGKVRDDLAGVPAAILPGAVPLHLLLQLAHHVVQRRVHVAGGLLRPDDTALIGNGDLHDVAVLLYGQAHLGVRILGEELGELVQLLLRGLPHVVGDFKVFSGNGNTHIFHSL